MEPSKMQEQANYIWNRLDDLAEVDPDSYKKFIETQMAEREKFMSEPEPKFCFETSIADSGMPVFINVCSWRRLDPPESGSDAIKLLAGIKKTHKSPNGPFITIPVAFNDKILEEITQLPGDKQEMMGMTITVLQTQQKILLSNYYKEIKDIFKGDLPADPRALFLQNPDSEFSDMGKLAEKCKANVKPPTDCLSSPGSLLKNLTENPADTEVERTLDADFMKNLSQLNEPKDKKKSTKLIEEIAVPLDVPVHMLQEYESDDQNPHRLVLRVNLPDISSVEDCDLEISKDELELTVEKKYYLKLQLPKPILDEKTSARFVRKSNLLSVTMPLEHS